MRQILIAAGALAVCGFFASTSVRAEPAYEPGGPARIGGYCKVVTDGLEMWGYYTPCMEPMHAIKHRKGMKS
jgi:hypothetical protein